MLTMLFNFELGKTIIFQNVATIYISKGNKDFYKFNF
jgi:hypothetical protein